MVIHSFYEIEATLAELFGLLVLVITTEISRLVSMVLLTSLSRYNNAVIHEIQHLLLT